MKRKNPKRMTSVAPGYEVNIRDKALQRIRIVHLPTSRSVMFSAFDIKFGNTFDVQWQQEEVFGRMDPIVGYKGTKRNGNISWSIPSWSIDQARENMANVDHFLSMLYPVFEDGDLKNTHIKAPPLLWLSYCNIFSSNSFAVKETIRNPDYNPMSSGQSIENINDIQEFVSRASDERGLLVAVNGSVTIDRDEENGTFTLAPGLIVPKIMKINFSFTILHTDPLGWNSSGNFRSGNQFPFKVPYHSQGTMSVNNNNKDFEATDSTPAMQSLREDSTTSFRGLPSTNEMVERAWFQTNVLRK